MTKTNAAVVTVILHDSSNRFDVCVYIGIGIKCRSCLLTNRRLYSILRIRHPTPSAKALYF